jgi:hypothetical protein
MGIKERLVVEAHEGADQVAKRGFRVRLYQAPDPAEECRELICRKRHLCNNAEAAATTSLQSPEQIRIGGAIGNEYLAICGNDLCLEQACRGHAIILREAAKPAALDESRDTNSCTPATLDIATSLRSDRVIRR